MSNSKRWRDFITWWEYMRPQFWQCLDNRHLIVAVDMRINEIKKGEFDMTITQFAKKVTESEGLKKQVNIAQIAEILKVVNKLLGGALYKLIRNA